MQNSANQVKNWTTASCRIVRGIETMPEKISRKACPACRLGLHLLKRRQVLRRILFRGQDGVKHGRKNTHGADVEGQLDGARYRALARLARHAEPVGEHVRQRRREHGAQADEQALHGEAALALVGREQVAHERAERLHGDVDAGIQIHSRPAAIQTVPEFGMAIKREAGEDGAGQEVRPATAERAPGAVAEIADDRLHDQARERRGEPEDGDSDSLAPRYW